MSKPVVTYGADPEFFVREKATRTIIPSCGLFGGEKGNPVLLSSEGGYLEDGVTIEINVAPQASVTGLIEKLRGLKSLWEQRFPQHELVGMSSAVFDKAELRKHRSAMEIGCNADLCAWGVRTLPQINDFGNLRFAGGHIHVGLDPWPEDLDLDFFIRWLDLFALLPTASEANHDRWPHYGRPGLYRPTSYGVEWRSPDNTWVLGNSAVANLVEMATDRLIQSERPFHSIQGSLEIYIETEGLNTYLGQGRLAPPDHHPSRWGKFSQYLDRITGTKTEGKHDAEKSAWEMAKATIAKSYGLGS